MASWLLWVLVAALLVFAPGGVRSQEAPAELAQDGAGSGGVNLPAWQDAPYVILISLDGFRADYLDRFEAPNVRGVLERGVRAEAMIPVFPTLTFPNHYSLVTGLHPERHGIIGNSFFDPARNESYSLSNREAVEDGTWYGGEPIWVTAERQGMVSACFFWPGSEAAIQGVRPTFWNVYDVTIPLDTRVDTILDWLRLSPERRPHMITLYMSDVDSASHRSTVGTPEVQEAIATVDGAVGRLLEGIERLPVRDRVYVVLTSDHGMVDTSVDRIVAFESLIDMEGVRVGASGAVAHLHVSDGPGRAQAIRDRINARVQHGRAYLRDEVPLRLRHREHPRIGDVVVIMDEGHTIATAASIASRRREPMGMHGWDPALPSMHAIFVAAGPRIRRGTTIPPVENVDVYPFLTELLGLRPAPDIDGRAGRISNVAIASDGAQRVRD